VQPGYRPRTVNVDGWSATRQTWPALYPLPVLLRCFLHGWLNVRSRGKLDERFAGLSGKVREAHRAPRPAGIRAAVAPPVGVDEAARGGVVGGGTGEQAVRAVAGVWPGVRAPGRAPDQ
jgi:hypothetical protein